MKKVLVAEDNMDNRIIAVEILEAFGYEVVQASNGLEAMEMTVKEKPDLVLLDLSMPKMDGWEVVQQLKSSDETSKIPVIAFTAHAMMGDDRKAKDAGCDDYIAKPCTPKNLIKKVDEWVDKK